MIKLLKINFFLLSFAFISCCNNYIVENNDTALIKLNNSGYYELTLTGIRCVGGHDPISAFFKSKTEEKQYLYTKKRSGTLGPDDFIITAYKEKLEYPYASLNVKGTVIISTKNLIIQLEVPHYKKSDEIEKYVPYDFNGEYELIYEKQSRG